MPQCEALVYPPTGTTANNYPRYKAGTSLRQCLNSAWQHGFCTTHLKLAHWGVPTASGHRRVARATWDPGCPVLYRL